MDRSAGSYRSPASPAATRTLSGIGSADSSAIASDHLMSGSVNMPSPYSVAHTTVDAGGLMTSALPSPYSITQYDGAYSPLRHEGGRVGGRGVGSERLDGGHARRELLRGSRGDNYL